MQCYYIIQINLSNETQKFKEAGREKKHRSTASASPTPIQKKVKKVGNMRRKKQFEVSNKEAEEHQIRQKDRKVSNLMQFLFSFVFLSSSFFFWVLKLQ